jgi:hypothetical protein
VRLAAALLDRSNAQLDFDTAPRQPGDDRITVPRTIPYGASVDAVVALDPRVQAAYAREALGWERPGGGARFGVGLFLTTRAHAHVLSDAEMVAAALGFLAAAVHARTAAAASTEGSHRGG